jgi:ATP-binding cassette subfamily C protein CydD
MNIDKRLIKLFSGSKKRLAAAITFGVMEIVALIGQAALLAKIIDGVFLKKDSFDDIIYLLIYFALISLCRSILSYLSRSETVRISAKIRENLYQKVLNHISILGQLYVNEEQRGELVNTAFNGVNKLDAYFSQYIPQLFYSVMIPLTILFFVFPADILSGIVLLITAPIIPIFMNLIGSAAAKQTKKQWKTLSRMSAYFLDILQGLSTLKIFGQSDPKVVGISEISNEFRKITMNVLRIAFLSALVLELAATISVAVIAVEIGLRLLYDKMDFEMALFILILAPEFYQPLRQLGARFHAGMEGVSAAQRIFSILKTEPIYKKNGDLQQPFSTPQIEFKEVTFSYKNSSVTILDKISFRLQPGKLNFLIGDSGAGKSTIAALLTGLLAPNSGKILIDNIELDQYDENTLREQISLLKQNPYIFHQTIYENLIIANPSAKIDTIYHAARAAQLQEFILSLPKKYQTVIGDQGEKLSGGQVQRLALARVILRNTPILILDEPTSNLDSVTEKKIIDYLRSEAERKTILIITHRLSVVKEQDNKIFLHK